MSNIDQIALDTIDKWEIESLGDSYSQSKAKLQVAIIDALKELEQENKRLREALLKAKTLLEESAKPFDDACMIIRESI